MFMWIGLQVPVRRNKDLKCLKETHFSSDCDLKCLPYHIAILGPIRWPICSLTNFGPLFTIWDIQYTYSRPLIQFMEGGFFKEICYIKNHPIALYCTLIENPRDFWPLFSYLARIFYQNWYIKTILDTTLQPTAISRWIHQFSSDHWS